MTSPDHGDIERRALALVEILADHVDDPATIERHLADADPQVAERVRRILGVASRRSEMPTEAGQLIAGYDLPPPERFGAFRLVAPIGRGGMGEVWRGERDDGLFEQVVAIKLIQPHLQVRAGEAFESERRILARFDHPAIARLIDGGTTIDGRACLVMEFVDGIPFDAACQGQPLAARMALFRQLLVAVAYAHGRLVAHGDLKPGNILVDGDGRVRLLDFGISRLISEEASAFLLSGAVTSSFASPARLAGEAPSIADDIFALGRLAAIALADTPAPEIAAIASKASAEREADRYATVHALLDDLDRWSRGLPVRAVPRTPLYVASKFVRRHALAIAAGGLLAATALYAGWTFEQDQRARIEAAARFDDARGTARYLLFTLYDELAAHPDTLALRREVAKTAQHYLDRLAHSGSPVPAVRLEAAQGLLRLAEVEGSPGMASLGDSHSARDNIDTALKLLAANDDRTTRALRFGALLDSAFLAENGETDEARATRDVAAAGAILATDPGLSAYQKARYFLTRSSIERWATHNDAALADADRAIALLGNDTRFDTLKLQSKVFERKGDALYYMHRPAEAIAAYRASLIPLERAVALDPGNMEAHRRLAHVVWNLGTGVIDHGDPHEALALFDRAIAEIGIVMRFDPRDDDARHRLASFEESRGETLVILGRIDEGFGVMQSSVEGYRKIWQAQPADARALRNYSVVLGDLANQQGQHGRMAQACANWRTYLHLNDILIASGHGNAQDNVDGIPQARDNIARHCR